MLAKMLKKEIENPRKKEKDKFLVKKTIYRHLNDQEKK